MALPLAEIKCETIAQQTNKPRAEFSQREHGSDGCGGFYGTASSTSSFSLRLCASAPCMFSKQVKQGSIASASKLAAQPASNRPAADRSRLGAQHTVAELDRRRSLDISPNSRRSRQRPNSRTS